jgi:MoxR-like ATPase
MNKFALFTTAIEGMQFAIKLLPQQPVLRDMERHIDDVKVQGMINEIAKHGIGTVCVATEYVMPEDGVITIVKFQPAFTVDAEGNPSLKTAGDLSEADQETFEFIVDYLIDSSEYGVDKAKMLVDQLTPLGFAIDWADKTAPKPIEQIMASGGNVRRTIATSYPCPKEADYGFAIDPDMWQLLVRNYLQRENTLITGPTGTGKTEILWIMSQVLGIDMFTVDMGTVQDPQSALLGTHRLDKNGASVFDYAPFALNVQQPGVHVLDEINRAPMSANNILFPALDKRRYVPIDVAGGEDERKVHVHPDQVFFATANMGSEYSGTAQLDRAIQDRFMLVEMDYPQEQQEINILKLKTKVDDKSASAIVKLANELRKQFAEQELSSAVSLRHTLQTASLVYDGFELGKSMETVIVPLYENSVGGISERAKVRTIMAAY